MINVALVFLLSLVSYSSFASLALEDQKPLEYQKPGALFAALAVQNNLPALTQLLEQKKSLIFLSDEDGDSALHKAVQFLQYEMTQALLRAGMDVNCRDKRGCTPLQRAIMLGDKTLVGLLLAAGANVNCKDDDGNTGIHHAANTGNDKLIRKLLDFTDYIVLNSTNSAMLTPAQLAAKNAQILASKKGHDIVQVKKFEQIAVGLNEESKKKIERIIYLTKESKIEPEGITIHSPLRRKDSREISVSGSPRMLVSESPRLAGGSPLRGDSPRVAQVLGKHESPRSIPSSPSKSKESPRSMTDSISTLPAISHTFSGPALVLPESKRLSQGGSPRTLKESPVLTQENPSTGSPRTILDYILSLPGSPKRTENQLKNRALSILKAVETPEKLHEIIDLIRSGAETLMRDEPVIRDESGQAPLHIAVAKGNVSAVMLLIAAGSNCDIKLPDGRNSAPLCSRKCE